VALSVEAAPASLECRAIWLGVHHIVQRVAPAQRQVVCDRPDDVVVGNAAVHKRVVVADAVVAAPDELRARAAGKHREEGEHEGREHGSVVSACGRHGGEWY